MYKYARKEPVQKKAKSILGYLQKTLTRMVYKPICFMNWWPTRATHRMSEGHRDSSWGGV